ncbi:MAG: YihY family inner membrane protein [Limnobacter sp.]|uniref:YihY family inner membrane protein n=1 Tax=Limnobacter sp. TaxID=2003368 RepID=UPI0032EF0188
MSSAAPSETTETKSFETRRARFMRGARRAFKVEDVELSPLNVRWWIAFTRLVGQRIIEQRLPQVASSLTFTTVLSLVPLATVALAIFTAFPMFDRMQMSLQGYLIESFFPETLSETILTYVTQFSDKAKGLTAIGIVFLVITALTTMFTVDRVFNQIWNVKRQRSIMNKVVLYWAVLSLAPVLVGLSISVSTALIGNTMAGVNPVLGGMFPALNLIPLLLTVLAFAFIYRIVPNRAVHWKDALVGGLLAAVLFEISKRAFAAYITHFPSYTALYGALAAFPIFLLWIYVSWIIVLLGASTVAALPVARTGYWNQSHRPGERWLQGLSVLVELEKSRQQEKPGMTMEELRVFARVPPDQLDEILNQLIDHGVIGLLAIVRGDDRFALICDPAHISAEVVAKALWYDPGLTTEWANRLPQSAQKLKAFQAEFIENPRLSDWLESPA